MEEIQDKIIKMLADKFCVKEAEIGPGTRFVQDLGADSLDTVELVMDFEKAFDIIISDEEAAGINSVEDAAKLIESKKNK